MPRQKRHTSVLPPKGGNEYSPHPSLRSGGSYSCRPTKPLRRLERERFKRLKEYADRWKTEPAEMEQIRQRAIKERSRKCRVRNDKVADIVKQWPQRMTRKELNAKMAGTAYLSRNTNIRSLLNRLIRHKLITFDPVIRMWANCCTPSVAFVITNDKTRED